MIMDRAVNKEDTKDKSLAVNREGMEAVKEDMEDKNPAVNKEGMEAVRMNMDLAVNREETFLREASKSESQPIQLTFYRTDSDIQ